MVIVEGAMTGISSSSFSANFDSSSSTRADNAAAFSVLSNEAASTGALVEPLLLLDAASIATSTSSADRLREILTREDEGSSSEGMSTRPKFIAPSPSTLISSAAATLSGFDGFGSLASLLFFRKRDFSLDLLLATYLSFVCRDPSRSTRMSSVEISLGEAELSTLSSVSPNVSGATAIFSACEAGLVGSDASAAIFFSSPKVASQRKFSIGKIFALSTIAAWVRGPGPSSDVDAEAGGDLDVVPSSGLKIRGSSGKTYLLDT
mmetsp:Transcript_30549/g.71583  ORF Transcript_30549/g.71583 Transcript_30549/m.71583 type:complete len:263 (-) Transcript_30549:947-1735(-)